MAFRASRATGNLPSRLALRGVPYLAFWLCHRIAQVPDGCVIIQSRLVFRHAARVLAENGVRVPYPQALVVQAGDGGGEQSFHSPCRRACNFSLLVQRKVTKRKHVGLKTGFRVHFSRFAHLSSAGKRSVL